MRAIELPDMKFLVALGVVQFPALKEPVKLAKYGFRLDGEPRVYRHRRLTSTQYTRLRRKRLVAAGLTTKGTVPKRNRL